LESLGGRRSTRVGPGLGPPAVAAAGAPGDPGQTPAAGGVRRVCGGYCDSVPKPAATAGPLRRRPRRRRSPGPPPARSGRQRAIIIMRQPCPPPRHGCCRRRRPGCHEMGGPPPPPGPVTVTVTVTLSVTLVAQVLPVTVTVVTVSRPGCPLDPARGSQGDLITGLACTLHEIS
jgi:hypothetical protein